MKALLRRLRGALGVGLTWAVGWAVVVFLIGTVIGIVDPDSIDAGEAPLRMALTIIAPVGLISGLFFAVFMSVAEHRNTSRSASSTRSTFFPSCFACFMQALSVIVHFIVSEPTGGRGGASTVSTFLPASFAPLMQSGSVATHFTVSSDLLRALSIDWSIRWFTRS